ncbi:HAD family hydrolase [Paenibacillus sp. P26]|nr:HAD family hydrolase [Paenibacillus sp. P26]
MNERNHLSGKRVIFFDVNQTLIRQNVSFEQGFKEVWRHYSARWLHPDGLEPNALWQQYMEEWQQRKRMRTASPPLDDVQHHCLQEAFRRLNIPASSGMIRSFMQEVRQVQVNAKTPASGAMETLNELSKQYKLAIISNSPREEVFMLLSRFGLLSFFPEGHVFTASRSADKKPAQTLFKTALQVLRLPPRQAVMVGNSWKHDVVGAVKAGIDAVWLNGSAESGDGPDAKKFPARSSGNGTSI